MDSGDMAALVAQGRAAHPTIEVDEAAFAAHLTALGSAHQLEVADLYLAFAAAAGTPAALAGIDTTLAALRPALAKLGLGGSDQDDVLQLVRAELLLATDGRTRILSYAGRGSLAGWLRSVVVRKGLRVVQRQPRETPLTDRIGSVSDNIELAFLKRTYGDAFRRAFDRAIGAMPVEDRLLLKQRFGHQVGVVELGTIYGVNAGTISRRVASVCRQLSEATRTIMIEDMGIARGELSSVMRLIDSQLEITLSALG